jgi:hypothetical protein
VISKIFINASKPGNLLLTKTNVVTSLYKRESIKEFHFTEDISVPINTENDLDSLNSYPIIPKNESILILVPPKITKINYQKISAYQCDFLFLWNEKIWLTRHVFTSLKFFDNIYEILDNPI